MPESTRTERHTKDGSSKHDSAARTVTDHVRVLAHSESSSEPCRLIRQATPPSTRARIDTGIDYGRMGAQISTPALVDRNRENFQSRKDDEDQGQQAINEPQTLSVLRVTNGVSPPSSPERTACNRSQRQSPSKTRSHPHPGDFVSIGQNKANRSGFESARPTFPHLPGSEVSTEQKKFRQSAVKLHFQKTREEWEARKRDLQMFNDAIGKIRNKIPFKKCYRHFHSYAENWGQKHDRFVQSDKDLVTMDGFDWAIFLMTSLEAEARKLKVVMDGIDRKLPRGSGWRGNGDDTETDNSSASFFSNNIESSTKCGFFSRLRCWT